MSPFGAWLLVSGQFYYTITREEMFYFVIKNVSHLCGLWRFANAYFIKLGKESEKSRAFLNLEISLEGYAIQTICHTGNL